MTETIVAVGLAAPLAAAVFDGARFPAVAWSYRKVGGLRFLRLGRLQLSWCMCRTVRN